MNYEIKETKPCADYGKISLEGNFKMDKEVLCTRLKNSFERVSSINNGNIIIAKRPDMEMYFYDNNRFVASKIETKELGQKILEKIFM